jgi:chromosomal replication initiation ATPase DnaA
LIVDDIQLLGKQCPQQQSRFQNMLQSLCADFKQIVMFGEVPVDQIKGLSNPELISQFEWGLEMEEAC